MKFLIKYLRRRKIAKLAEKLYLSDSSITYEEAIQMADTLMSNKKLFLRGGFIPLRSEMN